MDRAEIGSMTAKGGFINEKNIAKKFSAFKADSDAQAWLKIMGYDWEKVESLVALHIPVRIGKKRARKLGITEQSYQQTVRYKKADVQIQITINQKLYIENLSLKKANRRAGYNQVDKRSVESYQEMWGFNQKIEEWLKRFTGETLPADYLSIEQLAAIRDKKKRRVYLNEIPVKAFDSIVNFFESNKMMVIHDILRGRGDLNAGWFLVTRKDRAREDSVDWLLQDINSVCKYYAQGAVKMSPRGSLRIGRVTMQRKGGTPDPTSLQFKINPLKLFGAK